jgi:hypothetical protein
MENALSLPSPQAQEARKRGLRVAAKLAAAGIVVAAVAAASASASASDDKSKAANVDRVTDLVNVRAQSGGCGCAPCWGPPAPPAMPASEGRVDA